MAQNGANAFNSFTQALRRDPEMLQRDRPAQFSWLRYDIHPDPLQHYLKFIPWVGIRALPRFADAVLFRELVTSAA